MRKWQILEFDGKPYYAFVPDGELPMKEELIPELRDDVSFSIDEQLMTDDQIEEVTETDEHSQSQIEDKDDDASGDEQNDLDEVAEIAQDLKPVVANGKVTQNKPKPIESIAVNPIIAKSVIEPVEAGSYGDLYKVKVEAGVVTLEKLNVESLDTSAHQEAQQDAPSSPGIQEQMMEDESQDFEGFSVTVLEEETEEPPAISQSDHEELEDDATEITRQFSTGTGSHSLKCKACSETFESTLAFRKHVAWTHKKKVCIQEDGMYICSVCDFRTQKKAQFATHLQRKHETWTRKRQSQTAVFPCGACGFVCRSKHSLQSHFIRKHTDRYEHQCKHCPKKFKVKGDLTNHVRFHHKEKPVSCDVCGKLCLNSGSLYVHQKWAHYKPKYECPICKRRMVTQQNLDQHMLMQHEKREKIVCAECGKTFTKKDSFKRHMSVHTGNKPYCCVICSKPFARRSQLRQHLLIHTGKRPFVCDICGKAFTQKPGLISHRKTHPGKHPPLPVMPIGDIVKEFTEGYLASNQAGNSDDREMLESLVDEPEEDEEEEEEYEEEYEEGFEQEIIEEEVLGEDVVEETME